MDIMAWTTFESSIVRSLAKSPMQALGKEIDGAGTLPLTLIDLLTPLCRELGRQTTLEERNRGLEEIEVFRKWVDQYLLPLSPNGRPGVILMVPLGRASANYRDVVPPPDQGKVAPTSYNPLWFASILGLPQLVVPSE